MMSRIAQSLAETGRDVVVVGPRESGSEAYDASLPFPVIRYAVVRRPFELLFVAYAYTRAFRAARERVTIASAWWPVATALLILPRPLRGRLAILVHGSEVLPRTGGLRRAVMRAVFRQADVIIANSRFTRGLLTRAGIGGDVHVVPLGVDMRPVAPARAANPTVLSVGRLVSRKGFDRVIDALPALCKEFPELRYEVVGSGPERTALEARAERLGVREHVAFLGNASEDELRSAYARAWCFALPVRNIDDDVEGFGIVYLEAAMASLPAIGGSESGASDAIVDGDTGLLVDGESVEEIAIAVGTLLRDRDRAEAMGARGLERARELTWMRTTENILAVLPEGEAAATRT